MYRTNKDSFRLEKDSFLKKDSFLEKDFFLEEKPLKDPGPQNFSK